MANPLQEQLLKAGLVNKARATQIAREKAKERKREHKGNKPVTAGAGQLEAERVRIEQAARDRALAAERNAERLRAEARAQARQIVQTHKIEREGTIAYRFTDGEKIREVLVNEGLRAKLAQGVMVIVRDGQGYELLSQSAAAKVRERDPTLIVVDYGDTKADNAADPGTESDAYYDQFQVPDDLSW